MFTKESIMTVYKNNLCMILTSTLVPYVYLYIAEFIRENIVLFPTQCFLPLWLLHVATVTVHTPQRGQ